MIPLFLSPGGPAFTCSPKAVFGCDEVMREFLFVKQMPKCPSAFRTDRRKPSVIHLQYGRYCQSYRQRMPAILTVQRSRFLPLNN